MIRNLTPADHSRCMDLAVRVGWPREHHKWTLLFEHGPGYGIDGENGALSAMVMMPTFEGLSFVAMMVVAPDQQGQGLGKTLLEHALSRTTTPVGLYATARGRGLYERLGFVEVDGVSKHIGTYVPEGTESSSSEDTVPNPDSIFEADLAAFGADRSPLLRALITRAERTVTDASGGFAIRWSNGHLSVVGPIVAKNESKAIALFDRSLAGFEGRARIDVPDRWPRLMEHASSRGLGPQGPAPFMTWPNRWSKGERDRYFAIALQAFG